VKTKAVSLMRPDTLSFTSVNVSLCHSSGTKRLNSILMQQVNGVWSVVNLKQPSIIGDKNFYQYITRRQADKRQKAST